MISDHKCMLRYMRPYSGLARALTSMSIQRTSEYAVTFMASCIREFRKLSTISKNLVATRRAWKVGFCFEPRKWLTVLLQSVANAPNISDGLFSQQGVKAGPFRTHTALQKADQRAIILALLACAIICPLYNVSHHKLRLTACGSIDVFRAACAIFSVNCE